MYEISWSEKILNSLEFSDEKKSVIGFQNVLSIWKKKYSKDYKIHSDEKEKEKILKNKIEKTYEEEKSV